MKNFHFLSMNENNKLDAYNLLSRFLKQDYYYLDSSNAYGDQGEDSIQQALNLFLQRPELGFVWLGYDQNIPVAVCVLSFAISTSVGSLVAKLDDVYVCESYQNQGIGTALVKALELELQNRGVKRIDTSVHIYNVAAQKFYEKLNFRDLKEYRLARIIPNE